MYEVKMKYMDMENNEDLFSFRCEKFNIEDNIYKFENIFIDEFIISDMEVNNQDVALISIK